MAGEKSGMINSLNQSETEVLHFLFRDPNIKVLDIAKELFRGEGGIRTNLTAIYDKLEVPDEVENKREWVVREYSEAYQYVFHKEEWEAAHGIQRVSETPEMYIKPPDPVVVSDKVSDASVVPTVPASPQVRTFYVTEIPGVLIFALVVAIIFAIGMGIRSWYLEETSIPIKSEILYAESFDVGFGSSIPSDLIIYGSPIYTTTGYLVTDGRLVMAFGDDSWINYTIYAGVLKYGCELKEGEQESFSTFGVRYNASGSGSVSRAYSWKSCESPDNSYVNLKITIYGSTITVKEIGLDAPLFAKTIPQSGNDRGAAYLELDKDSFIDYIIVVGLP